MSEERRILRTRKIIYALIVCMICIPIIILAVFDIMEILRTEKTPELILLEESVSLYDCLEMRNTTKCDIELHFNHPVTSGHVEIEFYSESGEFSGINRFFVSSDDSFDDKTVLTGYYSVSGQFDSYELRLAEDIQIADLGDETIGDIIGAFLVFVFLLTPLFIRMFTDSCCEYNYEGSSILIYAGFTHYYIKVNGKIYDKRVRYSPGIFLCLPPVWILFLLLARSLSLKTLLDSGEEVEARISPFLKKMQLKIADKLVEPLK